MKDKSYEKKFQDNETVLINPGMGFTHYEYSNQPEIYGSRLDYTNTVDDFPRISTIYLRLAWELLEPEEGRFDWSWFDGPGQRWIDKGKRLVLRVTNHSKEHIYSHKYGQQRLLGRSHGLGTGSGDVNG